MAITVPSPRWVIGGTSSGASQALTVSTTSGNTVILTVSVYPSGSADVTVTSTPSTTFTKRVRLNNSGSGEDLYVFEAPNAAALTQIVANCTTNSYFSMVAMQVTGLVTAGAFDASGTATGTSNSPTATTSGSVANTEELVVGAMVNTAGNTTTVDPGSGFTMSADMKNLAGATSNVTCMEYKIGTGLSGTQAAGMATGNADTWNMIVATFQQAAAGAAAPFPPWPQTQRVIVRG